MDFIERWFGVSPDGGNGSLELIYVAVAMMAVALWLHWRQRRSTTDSER